MTGFSSIDYLDWIDDRPETTTYDLGSSDLRGAGPRQAGVVPDRLVGLSDPDPGVALDEQLAEVYGLEPENVLVTAGGTLANVLAVGATLESADEDRTDVDTDGLGEGPRVLVEKPGYEPLVETPRSLGARVDRFRRPPEEGYPLEPGRVSGAATGETALVTVTNRHNPSGRLADRETLAAVADCAREVDARVLVDEVYAPYTTVGTDGAFGGPTGAGLENVVVTGSLTKFHGLGGLRIGWLVADEAFLDRAREVRDHFCARAAPSEALARRALFHRDRLDGPARELLARNADLLAEFVDGRANLSGPVFEGSTFAFLDYEPADGNRVVEAAAERDLLVVPGRFFDDDDRFRVSLGRDTGHVREALSVLGEVLDELA